METKKQIITAGKKGGRNPFGKIAFTAGGLFVGATVAETIHKWREEHSQTKEESEKSKVQDHPETINEEKITQNTENENETLQEQPPQKTEPDRPQPIDPDKPQPIDTEDPEDPEITVGQENEPPVDEVTQRIAESEEIDSVDDNFVAFMNVGEHRTLYTENGEVDVFNIEINDPQLAGYPFMIADTDGDGFYDAVLLADGTPANILIGNEPGAPTLDSFLAQAGISRSDLEEMHETDGGHLEPDDYNEIAQNDDPTKDMIDEYGNKVTNEQIVQNEQPATDLDGEDENGEYYVALLTQLLEEDDEDEENEEEVVVNDDDDNHDIKPDEEDEQVDGDLETELEEDFT